ncbi:DUF7008 domain-containing protein [Streptomyces clavifer]
MPIPGIEIRTLERGWASRSSSIRPARSLRWSRTDVCEQQSEEDRTGQRLDIAVPPKYTSADFMRASYWSNRGKLDVPKERFISYPEAGPDSDSTLMLGWAGWDHKDQAQALFELLAARTTRDGWSSKRIVPLLAGLHEVMPWVKQWHDEYDDEWGAVPADELEAEYENQLRKHQVGGLDPES